jgi:phosphoribosylanthranilate isomerase
MFRIKICGITEVEDARAVVAAGADAVGLNFYPKSPRYVTADAARAIAEVLPAGVVKVGLFVNAAAEEICRRFDELRLDLIQLHGDEPPEVLAELGGRPVIRAFRMGGTVPIYGAGGHRNSGLSPSAYEKSPTSDRSATDMDTLPGPLRSIGDYLACCQRLGHLPALILVDAHVEGQYGGTGQLADWHVLKGYPTDGSLPRAILAGGLTAENVAEAIRTANPWGVDTASGVESSPGRKDPAAVEAFVRAARTALGLE